MKKRIADIIGEEYKEWGTKVVWGENDVIYIDSQTGSGKSYFICHRLLEHAISGQRRILYLVNRRILQEQVQREVNDAIDEISKKHGMLYSSSYYITVMSYQALEEMIENNGMQWVSNFLWQYTYLVADEIHYFLQESTYNTSTFSSFNAIMNQVGQVRIFMSATMEAIKGVIENKRKEIHVTQNGAYIPLREPRIYSMEQNYQHIKLKFFTDFVSLAKIIKQDTDKWLIVVDSKVKGMKAFKELEKNSIDVVFIDAEYENDSVSYDTVRDIVDEKKFSSRVLISTIVLDNGLTINDEELRNLVIVADTEVEFKQILGRKRLLENEDNVNVYIMRRERSDFAYRLLLAQKHLDFIHTYETYMQRQMNSCYTNNSFAFGYLRNKGNKYLMNLILKNEKAYRCAKHVLYYVNGDLGINPLSGMQYIILKKNYEDILERFTKDGNDAFFKCQAEWLGIENIDSELEEYKNSQEDKRRMSVISEIEAVVRCGSKMLIEEYKIKRETFRPLLYELFCEYVEENGTEEDEVRNKSVMKNLMSSNRSTTKDTFNYVMECLELPYCLETQGTKPEKYRICRIEEVEE